MALAGANLDNAPDTDSGSLYLLRLVSGSWVQTKIGITDPDPGDQIGYSVALDGQLGATGIPYRDTDRGTNAGAVAVFDLVY